MIRDHPWLSTREFTLRRSSTVLACTGVDPRQGTEALGASVFSLFVKEGSGCTGPPALPGGPSPPIVSYWTWDAGGGSFI